ncbi:MAG: acetate--CoA ligase family protein [Candidatus Baldrarchaeia archaeon]
MVNTPSVKSKQELKTLRYEGTLLHDELKYFFEPKSVAVIGASATPGKLGYNVLVNLIKGKFHGKIYPINPNLKEIFGLKCYRSILDVPNEVDLAVLIVPAKIILDVLMDCVSKGVRAVIIEAGGFAEMGEEGSLLQEKIREIARKGNIRIIGPNCAGIVNTHRNLVTTFAEVKNLRKGGISFITQAGIFAAGMLEIYGPRWGISKIITIGNKVDVDEADMLEYLAEDPETKVVGMYLEGVSDGRKFLKSLKKTVLKKPVVILKGGRTEEGKRAVRSHTASLAGNVEIYDAAFKQCGAIKAENLEQLFDSVRFFALQPLMRGNKIAVVTYAGSMGVLSVDRAASLGLKIAELPNTVLKKLRGIAFPWTSNFNPLDLSFLVTIEQYVESARIFMRAETVSGISLIVPALKVVEVGKAVAEILENGNTKPLVFCVPLGEYVMEDIQKVEELGIPCYPTPERAIDALYVSHKYYLYLKNRGVCMKL